MDNIETKTHGSTSHSNRLVLDEKVMMCPGVGCPMRGKCWRFRLDRFYDTVARIPHSDPRWLEPSYSKGQKNCPFFRPVQFVDNNKKIY